MSTSGEEIPTVPDGYEMYEVSVDANGQQKQRIWRGGKSKCNPDAKDFLKQMMNTPVEGYASPEEIDHGATEEMERQGVVPSIPTAPVKKPLDANKAKPPAQKGRQMYREV